MLCKYTKLMHLDFSDISHYRCYDKEGEDGIAYQEPHGEG